MSTDDTFPPAEVMPPYEVTITIERPDKVVSKIYVRQPVPIDPVVLEGTMKLLALAFGARFDGPAVTAKAPSRAQVVDVFNPRTNAKDRQAYEEARTRPPAGGNNAEE